VGRGDSEWSKKWFWRKPISSNRMGLRCALSNDPRNGSKIQPISSGKTNQGESIPCCDGAACPQRSMSSPYWRLWGRGLRLPRIVTTCHDMSPGHRDIVGLFFDAQVCPWVGHPGPWISLWDLSQTLQLWLQSGRGKDLSGAWKRLGDDRWQKSLLYEVLYCNLWRYVKV